MACRVLWAKSANPRQPSAWAKSTGTPLFMVGHITKEGRWQAPRSSSTWWTWCCNLKGTETTPIACSVRPKTDSARRLSWAFTKWAETACRRWTIGRSAALGERGDASSGLAVAVSLQGARPLLVEIQALVSTAVYGTPQRSGTGLICVASTCSSPFWKSVADSSSAQFDVFLNLAGGLKIQDPANDLAVVAAILSSSLDLPLDNRTCFAGKWD